MKRGFYGFYRGEAFQVGLSGTVWVYDARDSLVGRFRETPHSYVGAFLPGSDVFVTHTNEGHLAA